MRKLRQKLVLRALTEGRFWLGLGYRAAAWRRFARRLARHPTQDLAVLRLERRTDASIPYFVWLTYRLGRTPGGARALRPDKINLPDDDDPESLRGTPAELQGLAFFAPECGVVGGYTDGMTSRVGPKGQVVIPKAMRDQLGLRPGDLVAFSLVDGGVRVEPVGAAAELRGRLRGVRLVQALEEDHEDERTR